MTSTCSGGGGGRIFPGVGGVGGGSGVKQGGDGGSAGGAGGNGGPDESAGGGGGWGAFGGDFLDGADPDVFGAAGGKAVALNGYTVTWSGTFDTEFSTRVFGAVS